MTTPIDFYFDFYSPYGYLASLRIDTIAARHDREVVWHPFLMGIAFKVTDTSPIMETPLLGDYAWHDVKRSARLHGIRIKTPPNFPAAALAASRAFFWLHDQDAGQAKRLAQEVYHRIWTEGRDGADPEAVLNLAADLGISRDALATAIQSPEVKNRLKTETQAAIDRGVFGSPFIIVDDEPFWGNDRLEQVEKWLETGGW